MGTVAETYLGIHGEAHHGEDGRAEAQRLLHAAVQQLTLLHTVIVHRPVLAKHIQLLLIALVLEHQTQTGL